MSWGASHVAHRLQSSAAQYAAYAALVSIEAVIFAPLLFIAELKAQGKLKKKHVMNKLCTKCHKETQKTGEKSGPTTCSKCHIKD